MFLAVVHKSKRVDTSRTRGSRLVGGWMLDVGPLRCLKLDAKRMYKGTKSMYKGTRDKVQRDKGQRLEVGPLRCWMLEVGGGVAAG